jgi:hypothetical protein
MTEQLFTLEEAREAYRRVSLRADAAVWFIGELRAKRIWIDQKIAVSAIATECWDLVRDEDVYDEFQSPQNYLRHLVNEGCLEIPPATEEINGQGALCLQPFFALSRYRFSSALGLGYLGVHGDAKHLLSSEVVRHPVGQACEGLSDWEVELLTKALCDRSLVLVNDMRNMQTALEYVKTARSGKYESCSPKGVVQEDEGIDELIFRLEATVTLDFSPPPDRTFGTRALELNPLAVLPREALELLDV